MEEKPISSISLELLMNLYIGSHQRYPIDIGALKNFIKFTGKHLCQILCFNKVAGKKNCEKETLAQVFSCKFCKNFKNIFFTEHLRTTASALSLVWSNQGQSFLTQIRHFCCYCSEALLSNTRELIIKPFEILSLSSEI